MKAAYIEKTGPPGNIIYSDLPRPEPTGTQVLVKIAAVAVNPVDTYVRAGLIPFELPRPFIVGCDLAGVIEDVGPKATRFAPGDRVWGSNQGLLGRQGTFAEYAAVDECWLYATPDGVSDNQAAAISLVGITGLLGLEHHAGLRAGESLFVHGGAGGVGSCVVQMAKAMGARVMTTAGTDEKEEACLALGADVAVNYKTDDVDGAIGRFAPNGIDVWWETLSQQDLERAVGHLAMGGRLILMAGRDARPPFPVGPFYAKDCSAHGFAMFNATAAKQRKCAAQINRWLAEGKLSARVDRTMRLSETAEAHLLQEQNTLGMAGTLSGKIVLTP